MSSKLFKNKNELEAFLFLVLRNIIICICCHLISSRVESLLMWYKKITWRMLNNQDCIAATTMNKNCTKNSV